MAGLYTIFGTNKHLCPLEEHSRCNVVVDGSNLQHFFSSRNNALTNLPAYEQAVRNFFQHFLNAQITPYVFFDGPIRDDPHKWQRGRKRREERLEKLMHHMHHHYKMEYPQPAGVQDIFRDVIHSLDIQAIQVSAERDYTIEMILHARYKDAFLVSGNTKFFLEDIPRGFACVRADFLENFRAKQRCVMKTFHFKNLCRIIGLDESPNPDALTMWGVVLYNRDTFEDFTEYFFGESARAAHFYPKGRCAWMQELLSEKNRKVSQLKLLQFFLENYRWHAEQVVSSKLQPGKCREATLLFEKSLEVHHPQHGDVFRQIEYEINTGQFCEDNLPLWFLRYLTLEVKIMPGLMDLITDRKHYLLSYLENFKKGTVNETTVRLRRIIYGILFSNNNKRSYAGGSVEITELDRVGDRLKEIIRTPVLQLSNPNDVYGPRAVPGLDDMEGLSELERLELFLLSMGVDKDLHRSFESKEALYVTVVLRYWTISSAGFKERDLIRVLMTILLVEAKYRKSSHVFVGPVKLRNKARANLKIEFHPGKVAAPRRSLSIMHPHSQLQNVMVFARTLHRLFMQPLGATVDAIESITSEVVFYQICKLTRNLNDEQVEDFFADRMDEASENNFLDTLDIILDEDAVSLGKEIVKGFQGDDEHPRAWDDYYDYYSYYD